MKAEGALLHREDSPTAANAHNRLFGDTGVISYRVQMLTAVGGFIPVDVEASSGDDAASRALAQYPGAKVAHVAPTPQKAN